VEEGLKEYGIDPCLLKFVDYPTELLEISLSPTAIRPMPHTKNLI
jgi:hypothetical protein